MEAFGEVDVSDSTDWLGTPLAALAPVESAFRCELCKDFYNSPMITSCNHTFCSICIRRCLSQEGKCPLCRATDQESKLRGNWAMREAVEAFKQARDQILQFAKTPIPTATPASPKRKAGELDDIEDGEPGSKRPRKSTRSSKTRGAEATAAMAREEAHFQDEYREEEDSEPDDGLVSCPICWTRMLPQKVDRHLDTSCPGTPQPQPQPPQSSFSNNPYSHTLQASPRKSKPPERLPALAYSMLKDTALRKKMSELGLSTAGSRQILERRHSEWVTLWNANCDSARPKKRSELLHDLDVWEKTIGSRAPTQSRAANMGAQIKDKDFDGAAWAAKHDTSFKDLIANARRTRLQAEKGVGDKGGQNVVSEESSRQELYTAEEKIEEAPCYVPY
ncbi:hypothetical protein B0T16DRAFT_328734 [Cercophora newfieldiana]|uniref:Postreplication repair E3 ubiquitin-protein ligase RAD18 n=1 Tax=Cercophora newfieldiana TaxID=92897 RepID=A0AA39Y406_9PEZI|nr:hypothetical protein B0T16DRAFT_328734 [Cercophora newfieldiana]